jgi:hypothetical protein
VGEGGEVALGSGRCFSRDGENWRKEQLSFMVQSPPGDRSALSQQEAEAVTEPGQWLGPESSLSLGPLAEWVSEPFW